MKEQAAREADRSHAGAAAPAQMPEEIEGRSLTGAVRMCFAIAGVVACLLAVNQLLNLHLFIGVVFIDNRYLYILAATLFPLIFIVFPIRKTDATYDALVRLAARADRVCGTYMVRLRRRSHPQRRLGIWRAAHAPKFSPASLWLLILEALRRTSGLPMMLIVTVVSLYPMVADWIPNPLKGNPQEFGDTLAYHITSAESAFGIPMRAFAEIVVGFIVFGSALNHTGGGRFFNDLAFALVGRWRGGAAQVGIISSALQGSISGSVISNVISSGVVTIPAMKRTGFRADYAGAVEAVASTGAVLMPPVMGSTAFVMASFLGKSYGEIALAATVPGAVVLHRAGRPGRCLFRSIGTGRNARQRTAADARRHERGMVLYSGFHPAHRPAGVPARRGDGAVLCDRAAHRDQSDSCPNTA